MNINEWLFKTLCPIKYAQYITLMNCESLRHKQIVNQAKVRYTDKYIKVFEAIIRAGYRVIGIEKNKSGEFVIVTKWVYGDEIWVNLFSPTYLAINHHPRIMSSIKNNEKDGKFVYIDDILVEDNNVGNGSICMKHFLNEIKNDGYCLVKGELSSVDEAHFDRSIHFYEKFGFNIQLNENKSSGSISLKL